MSKIIVRRQEYANNGTHANEIEAVVKENLIANTLSSATDIAPSVGLLNSVKSELTSRTNIVVSATVDFKGLADGDSVDSSTITIPKNGLWLVNFGLAHCGANSITKASAAWEVRLYKGSESTARGDTLGVRNVLMIPVGTTWDAVSVASNVFELESGTYHATFLNRTGIATNASYNSRVAISAIFIPYT